MPHVAAYYFPNYHPHDALNDRWYGPGWTEWNLVRAAQPRFPGHRQPIISALGEFDESQPEWAARQIDLAADHAVDTFIFDWYWYEKQPYLHRALENGFLHAPNRQRMNFALMWANHNWVNIHPAVFTNKPETLAAGAVDRATFDALSDYIIAHYFKEPNYLKLNGCPYFSLYELGTFIRGLGGLAAARAALDSFRAKARAAGFSDLHLNAVVWGINVLPSEIKLERKEQILSELGFNSATTYAWVHHFSPTAFPETPYTAAAEANYAAWHTYAATLPVPYHPNVSMGWDSTPRTCQTSPFANRGYPWMSVLAGNTPAAFEEALGGAREFAARHHSDVITVNAWNEWTEGSYLLPDTVHGNAYLESIKRVFGR